MNKHKDRNEYTAPVFVGQNVYIKPNYIVSIPEYHFEGGGKMSLKAVLNQDNLKDNKQNGKLSKKAVMSLKTAINWLCISAKKKWVFNQDKQMWFGFKVNFITLTLPDTYSAIGSAEFQKKLLNPFLTLMRTKYQLGNYVWRLEFQAIGKLHCHITTDTFIHLQVIKSSWNKLLQDNGYLDLFYKKNKHYNPNSTDIHATKKIKNLAAYLAKYMAKKNSEYKPSKKVKDKNKLTVHNYKGWYKQRLNFWNSNFNPRPITGRLWSCSKELSEANKCKVHIPAPDCADNLKCLMDKEIEYKEILAKPKETISAQFNPDDPANKPFKIGEMFYLKAIHWVTKIKGDIKNKFEQTRTVLSTLNNQTQLNFSAVAWGNW